MAEPLIECVPNFSEGRNPAILQAITAAIESVPGIRLLARESDTDHNRSVVTFAGPPSAVIDAAVLAVAQAARLIDLNGHRGEHPRIGAADVVPLVPLRGISLEECAALAHTLGHRIWNEAGVPVYFYEAAAMNPERRRLENIRRGQFETLREEAPRNPGRAPDIGGPHLHPTAGATAVGARKILIACNINLHTANVEIAKAIAKTIRSSSGGLPHLKAVGLLLSSRNQAQVSMNLTDYEQTGLHTVFEAVQAEAARHGVEIAGMEMIGLWPRRALLLSAKHFLKLENYKEGGLLDDLLIS